MNWLREWFKSSYVRKLEEDCARLQAENRALLNSLLGTAGHPPIDLAVPATTSAKGGKMSVFQRQLRTERASEKRILERAQAMNREKGD